MSTQEENLGWSKQLAVLSTSSQVRGELQAFCDEYSIEMVGFTSLAELAGSSLCTSVPLLVSVEVGKEHFLVGGQGEREVILCVTDEDAKSLLEGSPLPDNLHLLVSPFAPLELLSVVRLTFRSLQARTVHYDSSVLHEAKPSSDTVLAALVPATERWISRFLGQLERRFQEFPPTLTTMMNEGRGLTALLRAYHETAVNRTVETCELERLLHELEQTYKERTTALGIGFSLSLLGQIPKRVLLNTRAASCLLNILIEEALEVTTQGRVTLELRKEAESNHLAFRIADTGDTTRRRLAELINRSKALTANEDVRVQLTAKLQECTGAEIVASKLHSVGTLVECLLPFQQAESDETFSTVHSGLSKSHDGDDKLTYLLALTDPAIRDHVEDALLKADVPFESLATHDQLIAYSKSFVPKVVVAEACRNGVESARFLAHIRHTGYQGEVVMLSPTLDAEGIADPLNRVAVVENTASAVLAHLNLTPAQDELTTPTFVSPLPSYQAQQEMPEVVVKENVLKQEQPTNNGIHHEEVPITKTEAIQKAFTRSSEVDVTSSDDSYELTGPSPEDVVICELDLASSEIKRLVKSYLSSLPQQLNELSLAIRNQDWGKVSRLSREEMRSSQASGFPAFGNLLERLAMSAAQQDFRQATTLLFELRAYSKAMERGTPVSSDEEVALGLN